MQEAIARAHSNIALVKYWGKSDQQLNIPAMPSLSLTVEALSTITRVKEAAEDTLTINGDRFADPKVLDWLRDSRVEHEIPPVQIQSETNFPTSSGLASSASGFAALGGAIDAACDLGLSDNELCNWVRKGSASAARSIHGGFVAMKPNSQACQVWQVLDESAWQLSVVVAVTSLKRKAIPSTQGMLISQQTSPFYEAWVKESHAMFERGLKAVVERDFETLATVADASSHQMHAIMMSSHPPMVYWNATTLRCIEVLQEAVQSTSIPLFFTIDAGPQVKVVCPLEVRSRVSELLLAVDGVKSALLSTIGSGLSIR